MEEISRHKRYEASYRAYMRKMRLEQPERIKEWRAKGHDIFRFGGNRRLVLERDNWVCCKCGMTQEQHMALFGRSLTVDHMDGKGRYAKEKNNDLNNLFTLCLRCHGKKDIKRRKPFSDYPIESKLKVLHNLRQNRESGDK